VWGIPWDRKPSLSNLVEMQYERNDIDFSRGTFRVRGDVIEVYPALGKVSPEIGNYLGMK
jgi:excinuclease ABC subunit B